MFYTRHLSFNIANPSPCLEIGMNYDHSIENESQVLLGQGSARAMLEEWIFKLLSQKQEFQSLVTH